MKITHFGHACLLVETDNARVLIDPGAFSSGFEALRELDAVLVTHQHFDHFDGDRVTKLLGYNPEARIFVEEATASMAPGGIDAEQIRVIVPGQSLDVGGERIEVVGGTHAVIHPDVPLIPNVGFYFAGSGFLHPGDELTVPAFQVDLLALPISGPWQRLSDAVDFLRDVAPAKAFPMHEAVLAKPGIYHNYLGNLRPAHTSFEVLGVGTAHEL